MTEKIISLLKEIRISDFIDVSLMTVLLYVVIAWFKKKKSIFMLIGIIIFGFFYLIAYELNLFLTTSVLKAFFAILLVALIIIFQEEIRSFFERTATWSLRWRGQKVLFPQTDVEILVRALTTLAHQKIGAILVIRGKDRIERHLQSGYELNGKISEPLLLSIFDPHSQGHDGAIVIAGEEILRFACHLPLSKNFDKFRGKGTRHAAALGLAEKSDALCLIVSEEQGTISAAFHGDLFEIHNENQLREMLEKFHQEMLPPPPPRTWRERLGKNLLAKVTALFIAITLWFVLVHGSKYTIKSFAIPVEYFQENPELEVQEIQPEEVVATFSGPRNVFHFLSENNIHLTVKISRTDEGIELVRLSKSDFNFPEEINLENIEPHSVKVTLVPK